MRANNINRRQSSNIDKKKITKRKNATSNKKPPLSSHRQQQKKKIILKQSRRDGNRHYSLLSLIAFLIVGIIIFIISTGFNIDCLIQREDGKDGYVCAPFGYNNSSTMEVAARKENYYFLSQLHYFGETTIGRKSKSTDNSNLQKKEKIIREIQQKMINFNLTRSAQHQKKFHIQKHFVETKFSQSQLYTTETENFAAIPIDDEYAYIHIWKCGGTSMELQTKKSQTTLSNLTTQQYYITFVRDPIDHFLSGWGECGQRDKTTLKKNRMTHRLPKPQKHYNWMIMEWLNYTKQATITQSGCMKHSFPQANYLMTTTTTTTTKTRRSAISTLTQEDVHGLFPELVLIAELNELDGILQHVMELPTFDNTLNTGRNRSGHRYKQTYFPSRIDWMSNETIRAVCEFVAIDYFLFDFEPPEPCNFLRTSNLALPSSS